MVNGRGLHGRVGFVIRRNRHGEREGIVIGQVGGNKMGGQISE